MSVEPKRDATRTAEIVSLDRMRIVSVGLQDATLIGRVLRRSYVRTVADVWKVTRYELAEKRRSNETAIPALLGMSKVFLLALSRYQAGIPISQAWFNRARGRAA
jgi:hypothetical protein